MPKPPSTHPFHLAIRAAVAQARRDNNAADRQAESLARRIAVDADPALAPSRVRRLTREECAEYERELMAKRSK